MACAFGAVPPGPAAMCSISRTARAVLGDSTRACRPRGAVCRSSVIGISSPSWANTV